MKIKLPAVINADDSAYYENIFVALAVSLFPLFYLVQKDWVNTFVFILFTVSLIHFLRLPKSSWNLKNITLLQWAVVLSLSAGLLAILVSQIFRLSIVPKSYDGPLRMFLCVPIFLLLVKKKIDFVLIFQYVCPLSLLMLLVYVLMYPLPMNTWGNRLGTYFVDPNTIGIYTMLLAFMCLYSIDALGKDGMALRVLKYLGVMAGFYLELKSQTRGAWIAEPAMLILWTILHWQSKSKTQLIISSLISVSVILGFYFLVDFFHDRVNSIYDEIAAWLNGTNKDTSTGLRLSMWQISWVLFKQNPFSGFGDLGYQSQLLLPQIQSVFSSEAISTMAAVGPHNEYLANMVRSGIFGLVAVLLQFFVPSMIFIRGRKSSVRAIKGTSEIGLCLVVGMMIASLSVEVLTLKYTNSFYGLMIACLCASVLWQRASNAVN